jgi:hypothetical protein
LGVGGYVFATGGDSSSGIAGNGGNITLIDSNVSGYIRAYGGFSDSGTAGNGGTVTLTESESGNILAYGANSNLGTSGNAGSVTLTNSTSGNILVQGGSSNVGIGGNGGSVVLIESTSGNILAYGGSAFSEDLDSGGNGGTVTLTNSTSSGNINVYGGYSYSGTGGNGGEVTIEDSFVTGNINTLVGPTPGTIGELTIIDNPPILTTPSSTEIEFNETFDLEQDLSAIDIKDGDLTNEIQITGIVGEEAGEYEIEYEVSDLGTTVTLNGDVVTSDPAINTVTANITITRLALPEPEQPTQTRRTTGSSVSRTTPTQTPTTPTQTPTTPTPTPQTPTTNNQTVTQTLIDNLVSQNIITPTQAELIKALLLTTPPTTPNNNTYTRDLDLNSQGEDVLKLQQFLISKGYSIPNGPTNFFGPQTQAALANYQRDNNITPALGYFGPVTRSFIEQQ